MANDPTEREAPEPGFLDRWLAPLILCGIAVFQFVLAHRVDLSPWKGGGMGMFSTVDSPSMRIVTIEGLDPEGKRVRIDPYDLMPESDRLNWKSWPDPAYLEKLADRVMALDYLESGSQRGHALQRLREENPDLELPDEEEEGGGSWLRPWRAGDPDGKAAPLRAVRVEAWKMVYDPGGNRIETVAIGQPIVRGNWP